MVASFAGAYRALTILAIVVLAGCAGTRNADDKQPAETQTAVAESDDDTVCQSQGFKPGSSDYVQCRKRLDNQHTRDDMRENSERENVVRGLLGRPPAGF
jgi:hypothetical protein